MSLNLPSALFSYVGNIAVNKLGGIAPLVTYEQTAHNLYKVTLSWLLKDTVIQDDWRLTITPAFRPSFHWTPHLTPTDSNIIAQHVFRAPAMIMATKGKELAVFPDLAILGKGSVGQWYMDMDALQNILTLGMSKSNVTEHVLYARSGQTKYLPGKIEFAFYILASDDGKDLADPWRPVLAFAWSKYGLPLYHAGQPLGTTHLEPYVKHVYDWAFTHWKASTWQEFELNGTKVGGVSFIVNVTQSPDYNGPANEREFRSIWNQAWFSSLRSASGLFRYARRVNDTLYMRYARETKELALAFPQKNGFFDALIATRMQEISEKGRSYNRSMGWSTHYFGNSNRNPYSDDPATSPYHILDMSYTALLMLDWYTDLEPDARLVKYAANYADALVKTQDEAGFFPAWLTTDSLKPLPALRHSPETSMSVTFLLKLYSLTLKEKYRNAALTAMGAVMDSVVANGQWEDFETYYSCSSFGSDSLGRRFTRNDQFKQNTLSMYWTAQALLASFEQTQNKKYLIIGERVLDELLMYQACWQPTYMYINTLGGFGVMNGDGEWNDARQSLFSELIVQYGKRLHRTEYIERGLAALRASFTMMYAPENRRTKRQWEKRWPFFGPKDYGFMMENYGHGGVTGANGVGIGEFTIYDWGNGAAAEAWNRIVDHDGIGLVEQK